MGVTIPLDIHDEYPRYMLRYLQHNGWHFNKALCEFAVSLMRKGGKPIDPFTKEQVDKILSNNKLTLLNNKGYDYVFVANMCKADYYGTSIVDEKHLAWYIKDTIDDEDAGDGVTMRRWYATMVANGEIIEWSDCF